MRPRHGHNWDDRPFFRDDEVGGVSKARRKTEDVTRLVLIAKVPPQASHHAERVGRPFEELGELSVIELESCALHGVQARLLCRRIRLAGGPSQYGWWRQSWHFGALTERRMPAMPVGRLLVSMADAEHGHIVEGATQDLHSKR